MKPAKSSNQKPEKVAPELFHDVQLRISPMLKSGFSVLYSFEISGSGRATFMSENVKCEFGYEPDDLLMVNKT
jgi:hypothetical protein